MKTLAQIKELTHEQLIVAYWDLQKFDGLIKVLKEHIEKDKTPSCVIVREKEGFVYGDPAVLINDLFSTMEFLCKQNNIKFTNVLSEAVATANSES